MNISFNPINSLLGIKTVIHEIVSNEKGILAVSFRFKPEEMGIFTDGFQMQFETIKPNFSRGSHFHYPESAQESFYLLKGSFNLIVCNIEKTLCEIYNIIPGTTYTCPGMIPHKAINTSDQDVEMIVAKPFNFKVVNRTTMFDMNWTDNLTKMTKTERI